MLYKAMPTQRHLGCQSNTGYLYDNTFNASIVAMVTLHNTDAYHNDAHQVAVMVTPHNKSCHGELCIVVAADKGGSIDWLK